MEPVGSDLAIGRQHETLALQPHEETSGLVRVFGDLDLVRWRFTKSLNNVAMLDFSAAITMFMAFSLPALPGPVPSVACSLTSGCLTDPEIYVNAS
jgi:hypothetical protein